MNRLARESSAYLLQHAQNPVDWYPWGPEAFEHARREDKPILLSVGYSACHWCHVMAHESFEDGATAALMNEGFVNIKVDREERPDVDQLYQSVVQLMGRGGGWPLTIFLRPDLTPFYGGTYFPPSDRFGLPSFQKLLRSLSDAWRNRRADVDGQAQAFRVELGQLTSFGLDAQEGALTAEQLVAAARQLLDHVDRLHGGFGGAPKFPNPMNVALLFRAYRRTKEAPFLDAALLTLDQMASGGLQDQLGGGFHRYSVDARWAVPHFEKMLYDNGQLLHLYADAQSVAPRQTWGQVAERLVEWLTREMTHEDGGFFATQDADSEGEEGRYFVWRPEQLDEVLGPTLGPLAKARYGVAPGGNFEHGTTVLHQAKSVAELAAEAGLAESEIASALEEARRKLLAARERRPRPGRDEKILAGWNGLMIRGLAHASRAFGRPAWASIAERAAGFLLDKLWDGSRLRRSFQGGAPTQRGLLEDYGQLAAGLVALYQATFTPRWLEAAAALVKVAHELFWDEQRRAYRVALRDAEDLIVAPYSLLDNATPAGASSLAEAQLGIAAIRFDPEPLARAETWLRRQQPNLVRQPMGYGHLWLAADAYLDGAPALRLTGSQQEALQAAGALARGFLPTVALYHSPNEGPGAFLCHHQTCEARMDGLDAVIARLNEKGLAWNLK